MQPAYLSPWQFSAALAISSMETGLSGFTFVLGSLLIIGILLVNQSYVFKCVCWGCVNFTTHPPCTLFLFSSHYYCLILFVGFLRKNLDLEFRLT